MQFFDPKNPNERKKMIAAAALALVAILVLGYVFFGGGSSKPQTTTNANVRSSPSPRVARPNESPEPPPDLSIYRPVPYTGTVASPQEADRNSFAYYEPTPTPPIPGILQTP